MKKSVDTIESTRTHLPCNIVASQAPFAPNKDFLEWLLAGTIIFETDRPGTILHVWNLAGSALVENVDGLIGRSLPEYFEERGAPEFAHVFRQAAGKGKGQRYEMQIHTARQPRWVTARFQRFRRARGTHVAVLLQDNQEKKELEQSVMRHRGYGIEREPVYRYAKVHRLPGLDPSEGVAMPEEFAQPRDPDGREPAGEQNARERESGEPWEQAVRLRLPDGTCSVWRTNAVPVFHAQEERNGWCGASYEGAERNETKRKLRESEAQLRKLSAQLMQSADEERRRLARHLHETVTQTLAAVKMTITKLSRKLSAKEAEVQEMVNAAATLSNQALQEVRTIAHMMHPPLLELAGLVPALRSYVGEFSRRSEIEVAVETSGEFRRFDREIETTVFRIVQEALTNVHRHSGATCAEVRLALEEDRLQVEVQDFGRGMDSPMWSDDEETAQGPGVGLAGIRERVRQVNGEFTIRSKPGKGTLLRASLPVPPLKTAAGNPFCIPKTEHLRG